MTNYGDLGRIADKGRADYWPRRIAALEARIKELETARSLENAHVGAGGITLGNNGSLTIQDADGRVVATFGALPPAFNRADGSRQPGVALYREDGTLAAFLGDTNPTTPPFRQSLQILDRQENIVVADDTNGGQGLANPYVSGASWSDSNITRWPSTTGATFTEIAYAYHTAQNPRVQFDIDLQADASTTGQFRLMVTNHTGTAVQIDAIQTVTGAFKHWTKFQVALPAGTQWGELLYLSLQGQRTAGTGTIRGIVNRWEGDQTP